jgi:mono/diheme cytochrome c family protein
MRRAILGLALVAAFALTGCSRTEKSPSPAPPPAEFVVPTVNWDEPVRAAAIAAGEAVLRKHQCARCHTVDAIEEPPRPLHCTSCHVFLKGLEPSMPDWVKLEKKYGRDVLVRYQHNIVHLERVPDLTGIGARVRADWLASFLHEPYDVRPLLSESMIRHALTDDEVTTLARYFAAVARAPEAAAAGLVQDAAPPPGAQIERGRRLFTERACASCHAFGNADLGVSAADLLANKAAALAPNLRFVRDRTRRDVLVAWIMDPKKVMPTTTMPSLVTSKEEAEALRDFILYADPLVGPEPPPTPLDPPRLLDRPVSYEEMKARTLGKVCVHCHMNDYEKDPGPGNRGGLGYVGVKLRMRTYEALVSGAVDASGARYSVLVPRKGETVPPIVLAMLRRKREADRDQVGPRADHALPHYPAGAPVGMPLGLPAMSDEEIAILATWIAQGCLGPKEITGQRGAFDGYLVPDGPIEKNQGCELRAPSSRRPDWTVATEKAGTSPPPPDPARRP